MMRELDAWLDNFERPFRFGPEKQHETFDQGGFPCHARF